MLPDEDTLQGFHTDLSVGDILRRARLEKNISIENLEQAIRVSAPHILAIEEGRLDVLPGRIYTFGFIRAYAEYVDLDGERILALLKRQSGEVIAPKDNTPQQTYMADDQSLPSGKIIGFILLAFLAVIGLKTFLTSEVYLSNDKIPTVPLDLKKQTTLLTKPQKPKDILIDNKTPKEEASAQNQIVLKAINNVWMEIRADNRITVFSRVLKAGEEYWVPIDQTGLTMTLGNAGGMQIVVDGQPLPVLGKTGQVIRKLSLSHESLKEMLKNAPKKAM